MQDADQRLIKVIPKEKQIKWQQLEFFVYAHFGMNTFTGKERGDGLEPLSTFAPEKVNADDWCLSIKAAGAKGLILTAKHRDGFCLWNTSYTDYSVRNTVCNIDIIDKVSLSCRKFGLKFGISFSLLDRHESTFGTGKAYDDFVCNQLRELLEGYGDMVEIRLDGASGNGINGNRQEYDWERYYRVIQELQPTAMVAIYGSDVRWCGREADNPRSCEWSVVPAILADNKRRFEINSKVEQGIEDTGLKCTDEDLGSRSRLEGEEQLIWYPAEMDASTRPGWFHHENENHKIKTLEQLINIYLNSVGRNSLLLLNVPPDKNGYIAEPDKILLAQFGEYMKTAFRRNFAEHAEMTSEDSEEAFEPKDLCSYDESYWVGRKGLTCWDLGVDLYVRQKISYIVLMEQIRCSQRIERFSVCALTGGEWKDIVRETTVGYKRICRLAEPVEARYLRVVVEEARICPTLKFIGMY